MENSVFETVKSAVKNWWISLVLGVLFVIFGIWMLFTPFESYVAMSILFSILMFVSGRMEISIAATNKMLPDRGWYITSGVLDILIGMFLMFMPQAAVVFFVYFVAVWLIFKGAAAIGYAMNLNRLGVNSWGLLVLGIVVILLSFWFCLSPLSGVIFIATLMSMAFIGYGIFRIMLAFKMRNLHKIMNN